MSNYTLSDDEVILYTGTAESETNSDTLQITLTSQRILLEQDKGLFKKVRELVHIIELTAIKTYQDTPQVKQHKKSVELQTTVGNFLLTFSGLLEARKFTEQTINAICGTSAAKRASERVKSAIDLVDDTLGTDTRSTVGDIMEQGLGRTLLFGLGRKKK